ncbi:MAG: virulence factor [Pseudomonadota bacterium]
MAQRTIIYWRDIPTQVVVKRGRTSEKRELPSYFIKAVDQAAMVSGAADTDAYLAEWRRSDPEPCGDDLTAEADAAAEALANSYDTKRLAALAKNGGRENQTSE